MNAGNHLRTLNKYGMLIVCEQASFSEGMPFVGATKDAEKFLDIIYHEPYWN